MIINSWYFKRLTTMSIPEILYRIKQMQRGVIEEKFGFRSEVDPGMVASKVSILDIEQVFQKQLSNYLNIFGKRFDFTNPSEINWHKDILSGEVYKPVFYRKINIRENPDLSAKCVWEVNRLQFLTGICMNYRITEDKSYLDQFIQINKSWSFHNPFLTGVNWYSNIEVNLRLITWFLCWEILETEKIILIDPEFRIFVEKDWLPIIEKHCIYSFDKPSKYSSANNHLISEYAGLFIAASKWEFKRSRKWIEYAHKGLEIEIMKQHSVNGINKEEAAEYIQFIVDFFLLSFLVGEKTGRPFSNQFRQQLYKIFCYIYEFLDCRGNFPKYGDEDDGKCFILDYEDKFNNFKSLLTSGAIIFKDPTLKIKSNGFDMKNHILFGSSGRITYESIPDIRLNESSKFYREEGHFFFRKQENSKEIYMHFDAASLGYLSIAAHGHADALSFLLHIDGHPVFIDSGTYTYHTEPEWRQYFIGTLAHSTMSVGGRDQAVNGGPTLWVRHFKTDLIDLETTGNIERVKASHDGYTDFGAIHTREIIFDRSANEFRITDTIKVRGKRKLNIEIPFHLHPEMSIKNSDGNIYLISSNKTGVTEFHVDRKLDHVIITGQFEPQILGWFSESFLKKQPTNVIYCKAEIENTTTFEFLIKIV